MPLTIPLRYAILISEIQRPKKLNRGTLMLNINPQYLVNHKGEKTAAVLSIQEYRLLMQHLEDLEDILDMDAAVKGETHFRDYREIQAELKKEGKL